MNAHEDLNLEPPSEAAAKAVGDGAAEPAAPTTSRAEPAEKAGDTAPTLGAATTADEAGDHAPKIEARRLHLIPYSAPAQAKAAGGPTTFVKWASGLAAGLALLAAVTAVGLYDHARQSSLLAAKAEESRGLAQTVRTLKDRIDAIEVARARDETADLRKVAAEMKAESGATRDLAGALAQLTARVDRVDHDQSARLDKLADRIDHDATGRIAELATRVDKLEKRPPAAVVAAAPRRRRPSRRRSWRKLTPESPTKRSDRYKSRRRRCAAIGWSRFRTASRSSTAVTARNRSAPAISCPAPAGCSASNGAGTNGSS